MSIQPRQIGGSLLPHKVDAVLRTNRAGTYSATGGTAGRGQLTLMSNAAVDGITIFAGFRVGLLGQTAGAQNGVWAVTSVGTGSDGVWDRVPDLDSDNEALGGIIVYSDRGTLNGRKVFSLTTAAPIIIGGGSGTSLTFAEVSSGPFQLDGSNRIPVQYAPSNTQSVRNATVGYWIGDAAYTYTNTGGASARGQITAAPLVVDGVTLTANKRVFILGYFGPSNGLWTVTTPGSGSNGVWDRAADWDNELDGNVGTLVFVDQGTVLKNSLWLLHSADPITIGGASGTTDTYVQITTAQALDAATLPIIQKARFFEGLVAEYWNFPGSTGTASNLNGAIYVPPASGVGNGELWVFFNNTDNWAGSGTTTRFLVFTRSHNRWVYDRQVIPETGITGTQYFSFYHPTQRKIWFQHDTGGSFLNIINVDTDAVTQVTKIGTHPIHAEYSPDLDCVFIHDNGLFGGDHKVRKVSNAGSVTATSALFSSTTYGMRLEITAGVTARIWVSTNDAGGYIFTLDPSTLTATARTGATIPLLNNMRWIEELGQMFGSQYLSGTIALMSFTSNVVMDSTYATGQTCASWSSAWDINNRRMWITLTGYIAAYVVGTNRLYQGALITMPNAPASPKILDDYQEMIVVDTTVAGKVTVLR